MSKSDFFIKYNAEDLSYEFEMLNRCKEGIRKYENSEDPFLKYLCIEGWLLHTRRIIESFELKKFDQKWKLLWGQISEHLSHANPSNRTNNREDKRQNPIWYINSYHDELLTDLAKIANKYKSEYVHYELLIEILENSRKRL